FGALELNEAGPASGNARSEFPDRPIERIKRRRRHPSVECALSGSKPYTAALAYRDGWHQEDPDGWKARHDLRTWLSGDRGGRCDGRPLRVHRDGLRERARSVPVDEGEPGSLHQYHGLPSDGARAGHVRV